MKKVLRVTAAKMATYMEKKEYLQLFWFNSVHKPVLCRKLGKPIIDFCFPKET